MQGFALRVVLLLVAADAAHEVVQVAGGELPAERPGGLVVAAHEAQQGGGELLEAVEVVRGDDFRLDDGEEISIWFSQDACTGVWIMIAFGCARPAG